MRFGSVCSGIEAASVAWRSLGWHAAWLAEIEPFPAAVLAHHYPTVPNLGDMTKLPERIRAGEVEAPDIFCGGTPCQAFSVAGLRRSLDDARGNLSLVFCEIANEIDTRRTAAGLAPAIVFWENVPGVLSTKDNAFGCFLAGLAGEDQPLEPPGGKWTNAGCVLGPQRAVAWRVTDAQYFGVAQRRRRVFVVASARNGFDPAEVLFEWDRMRRDSAPSREAGKVAPTIPARSLGGGGLGTDFDCDGGVITMAHGQGGAEIGFDRGPTLTCNHEAPIAAYAAASDVRPCAFCGHPFDHDKLGRYGCPNCNGEGLGVTHSLRGEGFDASEDGTGRGTPLVPVQVCPTLRAGGNKTGGDRPPGTDVDTADSLIPVAFDTTQITSKANGSNPQPGDPCHPLAAGAHAPAIAFNWNAQAAQLPSDDRDTTINDGLTCSQQGAVATVTGTDIMPTLTRRCDGSQTGTGNGMPIASIGMQVRRLTPTECERLQGFPDGYTAIPWRGKPADQCPDGPRYKALGNSWAVPNVRWIGQRIQQHLKGEL